MTPKKYFNCILFNFFEKKGEVLEAILNQFKISIVNDVSGGNSDSKLIEVTARNLLPYILMHSKGTPQTVDSCAVYKDLIPEILEWFDKKIKYCLNNGIPRWNIIVDPGFGFAKNVEQNVEILKNLEKFKELGYPLFVGFSNKRFVKKYFGDENITNSFGNSCLTAMCVQKGANFIRVHDDELIKTILFCREIYRNNK